MNESLDHVGFKGVAVTLHFRVDSFGRRVVEEVHVGADSTNSRIVEDAWVVFDDAVLEIEVLIEVLGQLGDFWPHSMLHSQTLRLQFVIYKSLKKGDVEIVTFCELIDSITWAKLEMVPW